VVDYVGASPSITHKAGRPFPLRLERREKLMTTKKPYTCPECLESCGGKWINAGAGWTEFWGVKGYENIPELVSDCCEEFLEGEWWDDSDPRY